MYKNAQKCWEKLEGAQIFKKENLWCIDLTANAATNFPTGVKWGKRVENLYV